MAVSPSMRAFRERHFKAPYGFGVRQQSHDGQMVIPEDITVLERDPSPCFRCGTNGGCKHRPWELGA